MKKLYKILFIILWKMNNLITVVGITIVSLLLASPSILQTENIYKNELMDKDIIL